MRFMPAAHLIYGYLGAGKTTFARQLERNIPAIRFSHDEWMVRLYGDDPPIEQFAIFYWRIHEQVEEIWLRCLELGLDVVLDFGFWTRQERDETRAKIIALGAEARLYRALSSLGFEHQERLHPVHTSPWFPPVNPGLISRCGCLS